MKKIFVLFMLLTFSAASFSQQANPSPALTKEDYLKKRMTQNTAAHFLLWGGLTAFTIGGAISMNQMVNDVSSIFLEDNFQETDNYSGEIIAAIGFASMLGSIPLFIAAAKNKRKAMSLSFKNETVPLIQKNSFVYRTVPSVTLKISL